MYAHGYAGTGAALGVQNPSIRRHLVQNGYAWAASSYSKNYYDVRAGVEDTNALALEFTRIASANSRPLTAPTKIFITGHSMGGHITAAAIEDEAYATASNKVRYNGAVPMCGVMGDTELFDTFGAMQVSALALAGIPNYPTASWTEVAGPGDQHSVAPPSRRVRPDHHHRDRREVRVGAARTSPAARARCSPRASPSAAASRRPGAAWAVTARSSAS